MKKLLLCLVGILIILLARPQEYGHTAMVTELQTSPVTWSFSAKKIADKTYKVYLTATIASPWSIYSQTTPEGGPVPTSITFNKNPLVTLEGKIEELGEMKRKHEEVFEVDVHYFNNKVEFVQTVKLKASAKTNLSGSVEFMACNNVECLPPKVVPFNISLP